VERQLERDILDKYLKSIETLSNFVGNTPVIRVFCEINEETVEIFAKYEAWNYSGSIKDRMALQIIKNSHQLGVLSPSDTIIEATSGNTGIAFAAMGAFLGHKVEIYMPNWLSEERKRLLRFYGAKLHEISVEDGGFLRCIDIANEKSQKKGFFCPQQFKNSHNPASHLATTAPELEKTLKNNGFSPLSAFVAGAGTGGTIMGVFRYFSEKNKHFQAFPVFPDNNTDGSHRIEGIGDSFVPEILSLDELGKIIRVKDSDAIIMARQMNKMGLSVGISSGANLFAAILKAHKIGSDKTVATVFADDNKKYLSTDLCSESTENQSKRIKLLDYEFIT